MRLPPEMQSERNARIARQVRRSGTKQRRFGFRVNPDPIGYVDVGNKREAAARFAEWAEDESLTPAQRNVAWRAVGQWKCLDRDERQAVLKAFTGKPECLDAIDKLIW